MRFFSLLFFLIPYFFLGQTSFDNFGSTIYGTESLGNSNPNDDYIDSIGKLVAISGDGNTIIIYNEKIKYSASYLGILNGQPLWGSVSSAMRPRMTAYKYVDSTNSWIQKGNDIERFYSFKSIDISKNGDIIIYAEPPWIVMKSFNGNQWVDGGFISSYSGEKNIHLSDDGNSLALVRENNVKVFAREFSPPGNWVSPSEFNVNNIIDTDFKASELSDGWISSKCIISSQDDTVRIFDSKLDTINGYASPIIDILYDDDSLAQFGTKVAMSEDGAYVAVLSTSSVLSKRKVDLFQFQNSSSDPYYSNISTLDNLPDNPSEMALSKDGKVLTLSYPDLNIIQIYYLDNNIFNLRQINNANTASDSYAYDIHMNDIGSRIINGVKQASGHGYVEVIGCRHIDTIVDSINVCSSYTWIDGISYNSSNNTATHLTSSINGCEQLHKLDLSFASDFNNISNSPTICNGDSLFVGGEFQFSNGIFIDTIMNSSDGCEIITTSLLFPNDTNININICTADSLFVGGSFQSSSGIYLDTLASSLGCDSIITTRLYVGITSQVMGVVNQVYDQDYIGIDGDFYDQNPSLFSHGNTFSINANGVIYNYFISYVSNPDSDNIRLVYIMHEDNSHAFGWQDGWVLNVNDNYIVNSITSYTDTHFVSCDFTWIDGITYSSSNNTASYTIPNSNIYGCDSVVNLNLTMESIYASIEQNGNNLEVSNVVNATYPYYFEWSSGDSTQVITPDSNTTYWVILEDSNGCYSDTLSFEVTFVSGMGLSLLNDGFKVYPNPTQNTIKVIIDNYYGSVELNLYNLSGKLLQTSATNVLNLYHIPSGVYLLKVVYGNKVKQLKIVRK